MMTFLIIVNVILVIVILILYVKLLTARNACKELMYIVYNYKKMWSPEEIRKCCTDETYEELKRHDIISDEMPDDTYDHNDYLF